MSNTVNYSADPESVEAYRVRVLFHCEELKQESNPRLRATIALYLAEAAATLARLEAEEVNKMVALG